MSEQATTSPDLTSLTHSGLAVRSYPVMEVFGPTVQGEGFLAGLPTYFVRFGGCDFRCSWCDSMFAVEPSSVRAHAEHLTAQQIEARILDLPGEARWVTLSGGNPALMPFSDDEFDLYLRPWMVTVETQGTIWRDWLAKIDHLTVSPKPPSSGMVNPRHMRSLAKFMRTAEAKLPAQDTRSIKIVVFDDLDYQWASNLFGLYPNWRHKFLSIGTDPIGLWGTDNLVVVGDVTVRKQVCDSYGDLAERVAHDPAMRDVRVLPQLHVLAYGHKRGV